MKTKLFLYTSIFPFFFAITPYSVIGADRTISPHHDTIVVIADQAWEETSPKAINLVGNIKIISPDIELTSDTAKLIGELDDPRLLKATGKPLQFKITRNADSETITGIANTIEYDRQLGVIKLEGKARIKDANNTIESDLIIYDTKQKRLVTRGNDGVQIVTQPK